MGKRKKPHSDDSGSAADVERQTQEQVELVPPERRPPTGVGAGSLSRALQAVRAAVGTVLDWADAAAEAVTKGLKKGAP